MKFAKDTKLVDFNERKDEAAKKEKEWAPATKNKQVFTLKGENKC